MTKVLSGGAFDIWHLGHIMHLDICKVIAGGDPKDVSLMLGSDEWLKERKGETRPILSFEERKRMLELLGYYIYKVGSAEDMLATIKKVIPDVYIYEYATNSKGHQLNLRFCNENNILALGLGKIPENPFGTSTTALIEKLKKG